ncbi:MAG TPA: hypothetical protein VD706_02260 [Candidatus Saccharimonadales bacterium]|nr:hypothetical protein [Candidatus Saccharimonadales bacterium]
MPVTEVLRELEEDEVGNYMPAEELLTSQMSDVYAAVGEQLLMAYDFDGCIPQPGSVLVKLEDGTQVAFSYSETMTIDTVEQH